MAGMKLDTRNGRRTGSTVLRVVVAMGMAVIASNSLADEFAGLADPTQPLHGAAVAAAQRQTGSALQSTFVSASQRRAVINGRTYKVGDKYGGGTITDIQPYEVVLKQANRETRLRLLPKLAKETQVVKLPVGSREGGKNEMHR